MFTVEWNETTGNEMITCAEDPTICPNIETLENMKTISIWGAYSFFLSYYYL